jgi:dihydroorotate dehydrogenase
VINLAGALSGFLWPALRPAFFSLDAERAHHIAMAALERIAHTCIIHVPDDKTAVDRWGLHFPNALGLAAGFDKDARCVPAWQALGFGFVEVGTVTQHAQPGNDKPRLFRLKSDGALLNRLGFNNHGADACARRIEAWRAAGRVTIPVGVNIGKSKVTPAERAHEDYMYSFSAVQDVADYVVVNVSSPNTPGLRDLQKTTELRAILEPLQAMNLKRNKPVPLLVKVAPDLAIDDAHACVTLAIELKLSGVVVSNTTVSRDGLRGPVPAGTGGISGRPLYEKSTSMLRELAVQHQGKIDFVGVGGISDARTLRGKLDAGAVLAQAYTGFIYGGPHFVRDALQGGSS